MDQAPHPHPGSNPKPDQAPFHDAWEAKVFALTIAAGFTGQWNIDASRAARESLPPAQYLSSSCYEIWLEGLERLLVERGLVTPREIELGTALQPPVPGVCALPAADVAAAPACGGPSERPAGALPRFAVDNLVHTRVMHPSHHTRLPRYLLPGLPRDSEGRRSTSCGRRRSSRSRSRCTSAATSAGPSGQPASRARSARRRPQAIRTPAARITCTGCPRSNNCCWTRGSPSRSCSPHCARPGAWPPSRRRTAIRSSSARPRGRGRGFRRDPDG